MLFMILLACGVTYGHEAHIHLGVVPMNRTVIKEDGTIWRREMEESTALYTTDGRPLKNTAIFRCVFKEEQIFHEEKARPHIGCTAAQMLDREHCSSTMVATGITTNQEQNLCWMGETGMACTVRKPPDGKEPLSPYYDSPHEHGVPIANCVFEQLHNRYRREEDEDYEDDENDKPNTKKPEEEEKPRTKEPEKEPEEETSHTTTAEPGEEEDPDEDHGSTVKPKKRTVRWNETARMLSSIGALACILLFLQVIVLAMSIKLIKRQALRDL